MPVTRAVGALRLTGLYCAGADEMLDASLRYGSGYVAAAAALTGKHGRPTEVIAPVDEALIRLLSNPQYHIPSARAQKRGRRAGASLLPAQRARLTAVSRPQPIGRRSGTRSGSALACSRSSSMAAVSGSACATFLPWSDQSALSKAMIPPGRSSRSAAARYSGYSRLSASQNTRS